MAAVLRSLAQRLKGGGGGAEEGAEAAAEHAGPAAPALEPSAAGRELLDAYQEAWVRLDRGGSSATAAAEGAARLEERVAGAHAELVDLDGELKAVAEARAGLDTACARLDEACHKLRMLGHVLNELQGRRHAAAAAQARAGMERDLAVMERDGMRAAVEERDEGERRRREALDREFAEAMKSYRDDPEAQKKARKKARKKAKKAARKRADKEKDALAGFFAEEDKLVDSDELEDFLAEVPSDGVVVGRGGAEKLASGAGGALDADGKSELEGALAEDE